MDGLDILDGTPVIDIKPYIPAFDSFQSAKAGWMDQISTDIDTVRNGGYQEIYSARGARSTRAGNRKRQLQKAVQVEGIVTHAAKVVEEEQSVAAVVNDHNK